MQVTESREVVLSDQDVGVTEERKRVALRTHRILQRLRTRKTNQSIHNPYLIVFITGVIQTTPVGICFILSRWNVSSWIKHLINVF